ncbi:MAG: MFS transporter [Clostridiaceae bacterium]|nr:MFS transporter [Clostridiaceae bacterium]
MIEEKKALRRIECNYAAVQGSFWASNCAIRTFLAIFLAYRGLSDAQIGGTTSLLYITSITLQLLISSWSDHHGKTALKKTIGVLTVAALAGGAVLWLLPLPVLMMMIVYVITTACDSSVDGLNNALMMQYVNGGLPVRYGWPRGIGSISYAVVAYLLGRLVERYTPDVLLPAFLGLAVVALLCVLLMPAPESVGALPPVKPASGQVASYHQMLRGNPTLLLLLAACILAGAGQSSVGTFLIRIVENLGGGTTEFGIATFISAGVELPVMFLSARLLRRFSAKSILLTSFICNFIKLVLLWIAPSLGFLYLTMAFSIFCFGLYGFSAVIFVNAIVRADEKVRGQSLLSLCYTSGIGGILGNLLSGWLLQARGVSFLLAVSSGLCLCGAVLMFLCWKRHGTQFTEA